MSNDKKNLVSYAVDWKNNALSTSGYVKSEKLKLLEKEWGFFCRNFHQPKLLGKLCAYEFNLKFSLSLCIAFVNWLHETTVFDCKTEKIF